MSGYAEVFHGEFQGATGVEVEIERCGFRPRRISIKGSDGSEAFWQEGMVEGSMHKRVAAGTGTVPATNGLTPTNTGFKLGTDAFNATGRTYWYELVS